MRVVRSRLATVISLALILGPPVFAQQSSGSSSQQSNGAAAQAPSDDSNSFPEDVSRKAAKEKARQDKAADPDAPQNPKAPDNSASSDNPFPEETSRKAATDARAAGSDNSGSGVSSSSDYDDRASGHGRNAVVPNVSMSHIHDKDPAKEDVQVGTFYLQTGDYVGAYARFKEASTLHPENTDAIFGLAEAARKLKKNQEAIENYKLFLDVVDSGSKAHDARKALASLSKP
jgi:tetratricopeptide (TPR) repeat protein